MNLPYVWRYRTNPVTCLREWFRILNTAPPEYVASIVGPCVRAGAVVGALAAPAAVPPLPVPPIPPPAYAGPVWPGEGYGAGGVLGFLPWPGPGVLPGGSFGPLAGGGVGGAYGFGGRDAGGVQPGNGGGFLRGAARLPAIIAMTSGGEDRGDRGSVRAGVAGVATGGAGSADTPGASTGLPGGRDTLPGGDLGPGVGGGSVDHPRDVPPAMEIAEPLPSWAWFVIVGGLCFVFGFLFPPPRA